LCKASKEYKISYNTPNERLLISPLAKEVPILKKELPYNLTSEDETKIVSYVTDGLYTGWDSGYEFQPTRGDTRSTLHRRVEENDSYRFYMLQRYEGIGLRV
jgi:hypothetical protein